ncbi:type IA DNA topoisomerase [Paenibacillus sp. 481]|uniref:type IA DNA topoisomerase n=1 Tax=Paenibacillus sp. 481 TaxID=2835869 RepID=UPI001E464C5D|nr:type IA DNA topoisomerase [Paenibacillus sp. 481]UHA73130.1 DNA topoisomerase 3 [Paenibacillus sp. 481]
MKVLVIAEKPDMGRNIAAAIEPKAKNNRTYLEGDTYIITWAIGHLISLAEPDAYDKKYKKWNIQDLPIIPDAFKLVPNPKTRDQLKVIAELAKRCNMLINACDAGREGQYIFSLIQRHLKLKHPVKRLWISDLTSETIRRGFAELKAGSDYDNLTKAARARSEADWLIGMNGSRAFTTKHNVLISVGRVQTPVLALLYDRKKEIEAFQSATYYEVEAHFKQQETDYRGLWQGEKEKLTDAAKAQAIATKVNGKRGQVVRYDVKDTKEYPFKLYDLTLLQREANAKFGFSAKKTLDVAQVLYEKHKVISYPRTTSNYVTEQNIPEMHKALDQLRSTAYATFVEQADKRLVHTHNRAVCNPTKVEDHHAILPTHRVAKSLAPDEQKVYDLIVRRFLAHFYPAAQYKVHTVLTEVEQEPFKSTVKQLVSLGWKVIYADQKKESAKPRSKADAEEDEKKGAEEERSTPFHLDASLGVHCASSSAKEKQTQPPKPYTEGTLLKAMESAGKQIEHEEVREAMKDSGLGTPATRASIIERLKHVGYVVMNSKSIALTTKGSTAIELIRGAGVNLLTSPEMTGQWERRLSQIARGEASDATFMDAVRKFTLHVIQSVVQQVPIASHVLAEMQADNNGGRSGKGKGKSASKVGSRSKTNVPPTSADGSRAGRNGAAAPSPRVASQQAVSASRQAVNANESNGGMAKSASSYGSCPRAGCGGTVIAGRKGYGCSHYKQGCKFVVWKNNLSVGKTISETMLRELLEKGETKRLQFKQGTETVKGRLVWAHRDSGQLKIVRE